MRGSEPLDHRLPYREGTGPETGNKVFDPLGLSKIASEETLAWYRAAELKHSRVAMVRVVFTCLSIRTRTPARTRAHACTRFSACTRMHIARKARKDSPLLSYGHTLPTE